LLNLLEEVTRPETVLPVTPERAYTLVNVDLVRMQITPDLGRPAVNELSAKLNWDTQVRIPECPDSSANAIPRLQNVDSYSVLGQARRSREPSDTGADNGHVCRHD
jgi:hypothetical protein